LLNRQSAAPGDLTSPGPLEKPNLSRIGHRLETYQGLSRKVVTTFDLI
jgi:hypothetical protein